MQANRANGSLRKSGQQFPTVSLFSHCRAISPRPHHRWQDITTPWLQKEIVIVHPKSKKVVEVIKEQ